ncbi:MAG: acyltransferase [Proteobacteria bacterium]|nr:acyltransferase [Pseudomonadota bacterium]
MAVYGVMIFFSISGYLVASSWLHDPSITRFFMKRSLRIFPALIVLVLFTIFAVGPMNTTLSLPDYYSNPLTWNYLRNIGLYIVYYLPGVFEHSVIPNAVNGSLWSLPAEFFMYLMTPLLMLLLPWRKEVMFAIFTIFAACAAVYIQTGYQGPRPVAYATEVRAALSMAAYFSAGAFFAISERWLPLRADIAVFALFAYVLAIVLPLGDHSAYISAIVSSIAIAYIFITIGKSATRTLQSAGKYGDFSYGMYLYAFPIQQFLHVRLPNMPLVGHILLATLMTIAFAWLSWHLVEKRALQFKPKAKRKSSAMQS